MSTSTFPKFWYESNACWGWVRSMKDLKSMLELQLKEPNMINTVDDFLDKSTQNHDGSLDFGTRREHYGTKTLREFLVENRVGLNDL